MKIKKLFDAKAECKEKMECLKIALQQAEPNSFVTDTKITLTPEQAIDVYSLLHGYEKLLNTIINHVDVGF